MTEDTISRRAAIDEIPDEKVISDMRGRLKERDGRDEQAKKLE